MNYCIKVAFAGLLLLTLNADAQQDTTKNKKVTVTGDMGIWYEGYGLDRNPQQSTPNFYQPRKSWHQVRYTFNPIINAGKWTIPFNFNFSALQNSFVTPGASKQNLWQFLTNPANSFGVAPRIGTTEILLGTQVLHYSDLSTGDMGIFGYGVNLSPGKFRIKVFNGVSQRPVNYLAPLPPSPGIIGAYQRNQWMAQLGLEEDGKYFVGFNFVKAKDLTSSVSSPPLSPLDPQDNMTLSFLAKATTDNGWTFNIELAQSYHTNNLNTPLSTAIVKNFKPFLDAHTSTNKDNAVMLGVVKKGSDWEIGGKFNYYGAGFYTAGYPFMNTDRMDYTANTRFNLWKKKINITASAGQRLGNLSRLSGPGITKQLIANINTFTQFNDKFSLTASFNNFGFNSANTSGYRSVSNELSLNPSYTWNTTSMSNLLSATYTWSKYDETTIVPVSVTQNNTQTVLLLYVPTFFKSSINPDLSLMWFRNTSPLLDLRLLSGTAGLNWKTGKNFKIKGQLQYSLTTSTPFTANKNFLGSAGFDWEIYRKLTWQLLFTANLYRYGTELPGSTLTPVYAGDPRYMETNLRTGLQYRF
nr:hypothetical protein [uncultured Mucilaginibacter sp.]